MMDTAALAQGEWIVRPLKEPEIEMFEKMAQALSLVISPFVILPPNSVQIGFRGTAALQWDTNIDTLVRKLYDHGVLFAQPHLWNDIEYDQNKCALATARNTITLMRILRICLRLSDAYMQLRCYKLQCWQPNDCVKCDIGHWMPHFADRPFAEMQHTDYVKDDAWQRKYAGVLLVPCKPIGIEVLQSLYQRPILCAKFYDLIPFVKSRHRRYVLACFERDSRLLDWLLSRHDVLFTLAS